MKRAGFSEEQIIGILKEQEASAKVANLTRKHGISDETFYKWKAKFGGLYIRGVGSEAIEATGATQASQ